MIHPIYAFKVMGFTKYTTTDRAEMVKYCIKSLIQESDSSAPMLFDSDKEAVKNLLSLLSVMDSYSDEEFVKKCGLVMGLFYDEIALVDTTPINIDSNSPLGISTVTFGQEEFLKNISVSPDGKEMYVYNESAKAITDHEKEGMVRVEIEHYDIEPHIYGIYKGISNELYALFKIL